MHSAFRYRLYPSPSQEALIQKHFGCARWVYNYALALKKKTWEEEKRTMSQFELCKEFPKLKKLEGTKWLSEVCSHSLQNEMANLDQAYTRFFREKKGFPKFKSKHSNNKSYSTTQIGIISIGVYHVKLPKLGKVPCRVSRPVTGRVMKATISQTASGKYFVSILCKDSLEVPDKLQITEVGTVGIDLGLKQFAVLSTGERIANPRNLKKAQKRLRRAQRTLSRRKPGSKNRNKARIRVAIVHEKVANQRNDFLHKLTTRLVNENQVDTYAIEDLAVANLVKNHRLARSISDAGWGEFRRQMGYKTEWKGKNLLVIGRFDPSSKLCSCGKINHELSLKDRIWTCPCGQVNDRDLNAARNIKNFALHPQGLIGRGTAKFTPVEVPLGSR